MAFKRVGSQKTSQNPIEYRLMTDNEGCTLGQVLKASSGRLTSGGLDTDDANGRQFIALKTQAAEATSVTPVPVERISPDVEYEVMSSAQVAATVVGSRVTLNTGALQPTATTSKGVFEISRTDGAASSSKVRGYFKS